MPQYVLNKIIDALNDEGKALKGARVLLLGVAYKENISDLRESPALDLIHLLKTKGAEVSYHDQYVPQLKEEHLTMTSVKLEQVTLEQVDCVVIVTAHHAYDWEWVAKHSRLLVDSRNATRNITTPTARIVKL